MIYTEWEKAFLFFFEKWKLAWKEKFHILKKPLQIVISIKEWKLLDGSGMKHLVEFWVEELFMYLSGIVRVSYDEGLFMLAMKFVIENTSTHFLSVYSSAPPK